MQSEEIKILICSDYQPDNKLLSYIEKEQENSKNIFGFLEKEIINSDISAVNLEYPVTSHNVGIQKFGPLLKSKAEALKPIKDAGFNLITLANNHIKNFGDQGVSDTITNCKKNGLDVVGAGSNLSDARKIYYKKIKEKKIAILNFAEIEFNSATSYEAGANPLDLINNLNDIEEAKKNADFVVLIIHSGYDFVYSPIPEMVKLYRFYAERGVSAIVSHHSHLISAFEVYKNVPIFYGLGNFIHAKENFEYGYYLGYALKLILKKDAINFELIPYNFSVEKMKILKPDNEQHTFLIKKQEELNLLLNDIVLLKKTFGEEMLKVSETRYLVLLNGINNVFYKIFRKLHLVGLLKWLMLINKKRYFSIWNVLRCEHHQDIINAEFSKIFNHEN